MYRNILVVLLLAVATSVLAETYYSRVKIIHLYPDGEVTVNITINLQDIILKSFTNVPYKAATDWFYIPTGLFGITVTAGGNSVVDTLLDIGDPSTLIFISKPAGVTAVTYADDVEPIDAGNAHFTFYNWIQYLGDVDVGVGDSFTNLAQGVGYSSVTTTAPFLSGPTSISLRPDGSTAAPTASILLTAESQRHYLIVGVGNFESSPAPELIAYELTDWSTNSRLAFVHGIPADLPVNVVANDQLTIFKNIK